MRTTLMSIVALAMSAGTATTQAAIIHRDLAARNLLIIRAFASDRPTVTGQVQLDYGEFGADFSVDSSTGRWWGEYTDGVSPSAIESNPLFSTDDAEYNPLFDPAAIFQSTIGAITGSSIQIEIDSAFSNTMGSAYQFDWIVNGQTYTYVIPAIEAWAVVTPGPWISQPTLWTLGSDLPLTPVGIALELNTSVTLAAGSTLSLTPVPTLGTAILSVFGVGFGIARRRRRS